MEPRPAPAASPPAAPAAPPAPPAGLTLARWLFVDAARTHEVHAGLRGGREFVVKESAFANDDPDEILESATPIREPWEAPALLAALERRLGLLGSYWKHDVTTPGWSRVPDPGLNPLDLRPVAGVLDPGRVQFHHFRKAGSEDVILAALPVPTPRGARHLTAQATLDFPDAESGEVRILHARLPHAPWRSLVVERHMDLRDRGYDKLVSPPAREALECYQAVLRRVSEGRLGRPTRERREAPVDGLYTDYLSSLTDPRLMALHARFLAADEEARALEGGPVAIRQLVARKRQGVSAQQDHMLLTILEASLLAREGLRSTSPRVDPEVAALVRRFAYYL